MDWFSYLVAGVMVYVGVAVFVTGMAYRISQWLSAPKTRIRTGYFPKPRTPGLRWLKMAEDSFFFPDVVKFDRWMWVFTILFHFGLLSAFVGHLRLLQEFTPLVNLLGPKGMDHFAFWSGGLMGIVLLVGLVYYLLRRLSFPFREVSVPEDYILLVLLMLTVMSGNLMRFAGDIDVAEYRAYLQSLLSFRPAFPEALAASTTRYALVFHVLFASLVFIFFPFSKLIHGMATFAANLARRR